MLSTPRFLNRAAELDLVGLDGRRGGVAASCKWRHEYAKPGDLLALRRVAQGIGATDETRYVLFSRSGFDPSLIEQAKAEDVWLVTPDMFDGPAFGESA